MSAAVNVTSEEVRLAFLSGEHLKPKEILSLPMVDRCRYVVETHFKDKSFSSEEVRDKLNELHPDGNVGHYMPMEVYDALSEFYGKPPHPPK